MIAAYSVYSTHFFSGYVQNAAQAAALQYVVPVGKVAVVRSIELFASTAGSVFVGKLVGSNVIPFASSSGLGTFQARHWDGDQVFVAGDVLRCQWVDGVIAVAASGFLLNA